MKHIAIDLGSKKSQVCIRDSKGSILKEVRVKTLDLKKLIESEEPANIVMEASSEAFHVARQMTLLKHKVTVVPSVLSRALAVGARGVKTDLKDAQALSHASCSIAELPSVYVPPQDVQEMRELVHGRRFLVGQRTRTINSIRGWGRCRLLSIKSGTSPTFGARLEEAMGATQIPGHIEARLKVLETLNQQIAVVTKEIRDAAKRRKVSQLLQTVPGVGPQVSTAFEAAIGTPERFQSAAAVTSYLGLTPGENSSGERERKTHITKAGYSELRCLLVLAAHVAMQRRKDEPIVQWALKVEVTRGKQKAVVALARKMAGVMWAVWKRSEPYDAKRAAKAVEPGVTPPK